MQLIEKWRNGEGWGKISSCCGLKETDDDDDAMFGSTDH